MISGSALIRSWAMGQPWAGEILGQPKRLQEALSLTSCHFLWMLANACIQSGEEM